MSASRGDSLETVEDDLDPVDPLAGLADRDFFDAELAAALADPAVRETVGLIVLEIDQFDALHDLHGQVGWDAVVLAVARRIRERVRDAGVIARTGVNELAIVVTDAPDSTTVAALAERMRSALEAARLRAGSLRLRVTASFGVAHSATSGPEPERLASVADAALARSRATGRNRVTSIAIDVAATLPQGMPIAK
jgi:diguanylate cyclase (GGDEF)-like protein